MLFLLGFLEFRVQADVVQEEEHPVQDGVALGLADLLVHLHHLLPDLVNRLDFGRFVERMLQNQDEYDEVLLDFVHGEHEGHELVDHEVVEEHEHVVLDKGRVVDLGQLRAVVEELVELVQDPQLVLLLLDVPCELFDHPFGDLVLAAAHTFGLFRVNNTRFEQLMLLNQILQSCIEVFKGMF